MLRVVTSCYDLSKKGKLPFLECLVWVILVGANILNDRSGLKAEQGPSLEKAWKLTIGLERRAKEDPGTSVFRSS